MSVLKLSEHIALLFIQLIYSMDFKFNYSAYSCKFQGLSKILKSFLFRIIEKTIEVWKLTYLEHLLLEHDGTL